MKWTFYDPETGLFSGRAFKAPNDAALELNTPAGLVAMPGEYDHLSQRVDESGEVVDWIPPAPDADHDWNDERKRWALKPEVAEARQTRRRALERIQELELGQLRSVRELLLTPGAQAARAALQAADEEIQALRAGL